VDTGQTGRSATSIVAYVLLPPPLSIEALDVVSVLLLGDSGSTISVRDDRLVS
jgi:hypothetical protein